MFWRVDFRDSSVYPEAIIELIWRVNNNTLTKSPCLIVSLFIACSLLWKISLGVLNLPCELGKSELTPSNL